MPVGQQANQAAVAQFGLAVHLRQHAESQARQCRLLAYVEVLDAQSSLQRYLAAVALVVLQVMMDSPVHRQRTKGRQLLEIVRGVDAHAFHQAGGGHQESPGPGQHPGDQVRVLVADFAYPQGDVHAFFEQVHPAVGQEHVQLHQWVLLEEVDDDLLEQ
ncbi:hypothetical protein D9M72_513870 [compost metagenome]